MLIIFPLNIAVIYLLVAFFHPVLFFVGLVLLLPFAILFYITREIYAWMDRRAGKEERRLATDPAYRAYKREQACREQARHRMIDRRFAARIPQRQRTPWKHFWQDDRAL